MASDTIDKHHEKNKEHRHKEKRMIREMNDLKTEMNLLDSGLIVVLNTSNEAALALFNKTTTAL